MQACRVLYDRGGSLELDICSALREDDTEVDATVRDALGRTRSLEERHLESVSLASGQLAQVAGQIGVPANAEAVLPLTEYWVSRLQFEQSLFLAVAELGCGNVADVVSEVWVHGAGVQRELQLLEREGGWVHVRLLLPLYTREVVLQPCALVDQPVSLLISQVAAPVRDLDVALQECRVGDRLGELIAHAHGLLCASWHVGVLSICEGGALHLGVGLLLLVELRWERGVVWHVAVRELDLGALLFREVCGWRVRAEGVLEVLLLGLADLRGDRLKGGEDRVGNANGLLRLGCERHWEVDLVEFRGAVECISMTCYAN